MWILCTIVVHTSQAHDSTHATQAWISCGLQGRWCLGDTPPWEWIHIPTKTGKFGKSSTQKCHFWGDMIMLVPWRILLLCSTSEPPGRPYVLHSSHASTAAWACSGVLITGKIKPQRKWCAMCVFEILRLTPTISKHQIPPNAWASRLWAPKSKTRFTTTGSAQGTRTTGSACPYWEAWWIVHDDPQISGKKTRIPVNLGHQFWNIHIS